MLHHRLGLLGLVGLLRVDSVDVGSFLSPATARAPPSVAEMPNPRTFARGVVPPMDVCPDPKELLALEPSAEQALAVPSSGVVFDVDHQTLLEMRAGPEGRYVFY